MTTNIKLILLSFTLFVWHGGYSQNHCSYPANNNFNTELGSTINDFDWTQEFYSNTFFVNKNGGVLNIGAQSPFHFNNQDENLDHLKLPFIKDNLPEDGWELLATNFGSPPPINSPGDQTGVSIPSFVLYNRYESKIRAFFYIPETLTAAQGYNKAQIIFDFKPSTIGENKESALFTHMQSPANALDDFVKKLSATMPNFYNNGGNYWLFADLPVAYDPCTCDHFAWFKIDPELLDIQEITLDIEGGGTITPQAVVSAGNPSSELPFNSAINKINNVISSGVKMAKSLEGFRTFTEGLLASLDLKEGTLTYNQLDAEAQDKFEAGKRNSFSFPGWTKDIPKIGLLIGAAEFLIGGGRSSGSTAPTSFETKLQFEANGFITSPDPFEGIEMYVPGSDQSSNDPNVTSTLHYNNILGVFNLLETPIIEYQHATDWISNPIDPLYGDREFYVGTAFKLQNEIKYVVNPASGLNQIPVDIKVALVFKDMFDIDLNNSTALERVEYEDGTFVYQTPFIPLSCINDYIVNIDYNNTPEFFGYDFIVELKIMVSLELDEATPFYSDQADDVLFSKHPSNYILSHAIPQLNFAAHQKYQ